MTARIYKDTLRLVGVGDFKMAADGYKLKTVLGCCVGICFYDKEKKIGALLHTMLPTPLPTISKNPKEKPTKFVDTGINKVLQSLKRKYGVDERSLTAKVFGGAKMIESSVRNIGKNNVKRTEEVLAEKKIKILNKKVGGEKGYRIEFDVSTGRVRCQLFGEKEEYF